MALFTGPRLRKTKYIYQVAFRCWWNILNSRARKLLKIPLFFLSLVRERKKSLNINLTCKYSIEVSQGMRVMLTLLRCKLKTAKRTCGLSKWAFNITSQAQSYLSVSNFLFKMWCKYTIHIITVTTSFSLSLKLVPQHSVRVRHCGPEAELFLLVVNRLTLRALILKQGRLCWVLLACYVI